MAYAIRNDGLGWRAIDSAADLLDGESYSEEQPPVMVTKTVPQQVTRFQALATLHNAGMLDQVEAMMAQPGTDKLTVLAWQNALDFKRTSSMVLDMAQALGLTDKQVDDLFIAASQIE